ncbi:MAG: amino acid permease, partial [Pseudomonadota bacterium]
MTEAIAPRKLGRWMSLAMVVGSMIGTGIYLLPATLAPFGPNIVAAFAVTIGGTMCLALALALLAARVPGGPFVYVERAFGENTAFLTLWSYMVSQWTGVAGVAVAIAGGLGYLFPWARSAIGLIVIALGSIFILFLVNVRGVRSAGGLQIATALIKIIPLLAAVFLVI